MEQFYFLFLSREVVINFLQLAKLQSFLSYFTIFTIFFFERLASATPDTVIPGMLEGLG